jgi:transposase
VMNKPFPSIVESPEHLHQQLRREPDAKRRQRLQALYLVASGQARSRLALAQLLAVHRHTIHTWLALYKDGGLSALLTIKKSPGKRPAVTPAVLSNLRARLTQPQGFGSYGEIQRYLAHDHKLSLAYSTVHALVRYKLQAKLKAPRRSHPKKSLRTSSPFRQLSARTSKHA